MNDVLCFTNMLYFNSLSVSNLTGNYFLNFSYKILIFLVIVTNINNEKFNIILTLGKYFDSSKLLF